VETVEATGIIQRGGVRREITVLFSDIRGFTAYSETRQPEEVIDMLNDYLQIQAEAVGRHGGDIDKFVGDEMMVRFDGPDHAKRAVRCAVDLLTAIETLNATRENEAAMAIGVGVNTGEMVLGAMGAERRMDFTVIGDAVNLGARLCSAAKPGEVLISNFVRDAIDELPDVLIQSMEPIQVKGKQDPIQIFRVLSKPTNKANS
jgi:adenylate cyclase